MARRHLLALLVTVVVLVSCFVSLQVVRASPAIIYSDSQDGYADGSPAYNSVGNQMLAGDTDPSDHYMQAFVKFSLSGISGTLSSATLNLYLFYSAVLSTGHGTSPLPNPGLGDCVVRHIDDYGTLTQTDLDAASIGNDPGVLLSSSATPNVGYVFIDVKAAMQDDINHGRAFSSFMIKMTTNTNGNHKTDAWEFRTSEFGTSTAPYIDYTAALAETVSLSPNPSSVTVTAGSSASTTVTVTILGTDTIDSILNPVISCSGLPAGATCSTDPNPLPSPMNSGQQFTLTVSASSSTAPGTYQVTVQMSYELPTDMTDMIQPSFLAISPIQFGSSSGIGPSAISISQATSNPITITVVVKAATSMPVHQTPVGGVMLPSVGVTVLLPWAVLLSLLGVLSVEAFRVKRRAKQR